MSDGARRPKINRKERNGKVKIGFFDSGIGGLSVLHQVLLKLPDEEYLFYADTDHVPFGEKTKAEILRYTDDGLRFLFGQGAEAVVIACNTATSVAVTAMRKKYSAPILGVEPAVKPAVEQRGGRRVMVVGTSVTVRGKRLRDLIARVDRNHSTDLLALPDLVHFAERGEFRSRAVTDYLHGAFAPYRVEDYSALVLGCTHFNYFKDTFRELLSPGTAFFDCCDGTANHLEEVLKEKALLEPGTRSIKYFRSGREITDAEGLARMTRLFHRLDDMARI